MLLKFSDTERKSRRRYTFTQHIVNNNKIIINLFKVQISNTVQWRIVLLWIKYIDFSSRFHRNSEAYASELLWNLEDLFPVTDD